MHRSLLIALAAVGLPLAVHAADQTVLGNKFLLKNPPTSTGRKIVVKAKETATDNTLVGDPATNGAFLIIRADGATPGSQTFTLKGGTSPMTGKPFWAGTTAKGFTYKDPKHENGPVKVAQIKRTAGGTFTVKAVVGGGAITVFPPNAGTSACALLQIVAGDSYSVSFATGAVVNKGATQFSVSKPTSQGSCVVCGDGVVSGPEQCDAPGSSCGAGGTCGADCTCPCEFLDASECMYPFPSDWLTVADSTTYTGRRVHFATATMPQNTSSQVIDPTDYDRNDGFSQGASILLHVPNVDLAMTGAVPITDIGQSLVAGTPIVVVNATTHTQHPIWAEIDSNATSEPTRALMIRPAVSFNEGQRYIVALRNMKDGTGATIPAPADFQAYRDNTPTGDQVKEARRAHMESIFADLQLAGVTRNDLYLAWDFTVASTRNTTERLLFVRDDGFSRLGTNAPSFSITNVTDNVNANIFRTVTGTFNVERYVDSTAPGARFQLDANGLPIHQSTPQVAPFECIIPVAALPSAAGPAVPARPSLYGHGLLGSHTEVTASDVESMANEHDFVFCATKWIGMADEDVPNAIGILQNLANFPTLTDRLQQAMLDQLYLARLMIHAQGFVSNAAFQDSSGHPVIDTTNVFYDGNSQGGIFGGTVMSIAKDITRGVLGVPGMNYSLLLTRSADFVVYASILYPSYPNELQHPLLLALIQMLWDRSDPNGYAQHMTANPLPNTPVHSVLLHEAFGDHQVANISTEVEARTIGASIHQPAIGPGRNPDVVPYYGIPAIPSYPFDGSALVVWDNATVNPPPTTNTAPSTGADPHSFPRSSVAGRNQKSEFLQAGGDVIDVCSGSPCLAP
jgi:hypothetical protein